MKNPHGRKPATATFLANAGRDGRFAGSFVNPPVVHASTVLFDSIEDMVSPGAPYVYGRRGTPTLASLETALAEFEGAAGAVLCPSGLNAITAAILPFVGAGDRVLFPDSVYGPARTFADAVLARLGVTADYYDPTDAGDVAARLDPATKVVYVESPGSNTMEMQDIPAIVEIAHAAQAVVVADNTWATPLFCRPLDLGADVALLAATKYIGGHADIMMGTVTAGERCWPRLKEVHGALGLCVGPDDAYLALRGLRTLDVRLRRHHESALAVATWLEGHHEVARVLYPALPSDPGHALWRRDMTGASGLLSFVLRGWSEDEAAQLIDGLSLFGIGYSWGGFESLATIGSHGIRRTARPYRPEGTLIRLHVGLEDPEDLMADLDEGLRRMRP
ncbi:MAG: cystathionine beta-lyase [Bauldia sp.]|nr:cystathionine beta-lyase [Bauldia sp.]